MWAEKQGLELAADCHLARVTQAAHLLQVLLQLGFVHLQDLFLQDFFNTVFAQARKATAEDIASLSSTCFKLNSVQLEALLSRWGG